MSTGDSARTRADLLAEVKQPPFVEAVDHLFEDLSDLLLAKHADYSSKNISTAPGGPLFGIVVRLHDKMCRLENLVVNKAEPKYEPIEDTLRDIVGYAAIGLLVQSGDWPE